jgi:hypothetical protein
MRQRMRKVKPARGPKCAWMFISCCGLVTIALFCGVLFRSKPISDGDPRSALIGRLRNETWNESIAALLSDEGQFQRFMANRDPTGLGQRQLESVLSCPRALKVIESIQDLSPEAGGQRCRELFAASFRAHTNTYEAILKSAEDSTVPRNTRSILATLYSMETAMFAAANVGRRDLLGEMFAQLASFRELMEPRLIGHPEVYHLSQPELLTAMLCSALGPDNRFQVNVLHLAATKDKNGAQQLLAAVDHELSLSPMKSKDMPVLWWFASPGYERQFRTAKRGQPSSKGVYAVYKVYNWSMDRRPDPREEGQVVTALKSFVLGQPVRESGPTLLRALQYGESSLDRRSAALALGRSGTPLTPDVLKELIRALSDQDIGVARASAATLARLDRKASAFLDSGEISQQTVSGLIRLLSDKSGDPNERWEITALARLAQRGNAQAAGGLEEEIRTNEHGLGALASIARLIYKPAK